MDLPVPALVVGRTDHARRTPLQHAFSHRTYAWLVDVDELPDLPWWCRPLAGFDGRDHFDGRRGESLRAGLGRWLADHGHHLAADDRVLMWAHARVFGHVFNPLSVFWIVPADGSAVRVVLEVHNTYGERHAYLLPPGPTRRRAITKEFYVSPFNEVAGRYRVTVAASPTSLTAVVGLDVDGERVLTARNHGWVRPACPGTLLRTALRHPLMPWRVSALIRLHGVRLWARRLRVVPRPAAPTTTSTTASTPTDSAPDGTAPDGTAAMCPFARAHEGTAADHQTRDTPTTQTRTCA